MAVAAMAVAATAAVGSAAVDSVVTVVVGSAAAVAAAMVVGEWGEVGFAVGGLVEVAATAAVDSEAELAAVAAAGLAVAAEAAGVAVVDLGVVVEATAVAVMAAPADCPAAAHSAATEAVGLVDPALASPQTAAGTGSQRVPTSQTAGTAAFHL